MAPKTRRPGPDARGVADYVDTINDCASSTLLGVLDAIASKNFCERQSARTHSVHLCLSITGTGLTGASVQIQYTLHYFSNNINTTYSDLFVKKLVQPTLTTDRQVYAYYKSETEIVETYKEIDTSIMIQNPLDPGDENLVAVTKQTIGETTFKRIDLSIGG